MESREFKEIIRASRVVKCLSPTTSCSNKIIRAHSIQNNRIQKKIADRGRVITFSHGKLQEIGRGVATVFTGFCSKHDTEIFSYIENKDYSVENKIQEFLFAYRCLCKELIAKEFQKNIFKIGGGEDLGRVLGVDLGLLDMEKIKKVMDDSFLKKEYNFIKTLTLIFEEESKFAVSSIFDIEFDFEGNEINNLNDPLSEVKPLFLTIFPQSKKTYVLFSFLKKHEEFFSFLTDQIKDVSFEQQQKRINLLITLYCENFVYSPEKWASLKGWQRKAFLKLFEKTKDESKLKYMRVDPPINFFEL